MPLNFLPNRQSLPLLIMLYALFASLPLVWMRLFGTSLAVYHFAAFCVAVGLAFSPGLPDAIGRVFKTGRIIWLGAILLMIAMALSYTRSVFVFEPFFFVKFLGSLGAAFISAVLVLMIVRRGLFPFAAYVPAVASLLFLILISFQFAAAEIAPFEVLGQAIAQADPNIVINKLFRAAFAASSDELQYRSNLKQSLSFAFVMMIPLGFLGLQYIPREKKVARLLALAALAFTVVMSIAPFSRAAWLALLLIAVCLTFTYVRSQRGLVGFLAVVALGIPGFFIVGSQSDLFALIEARLSSTDSVDARLYAVEKHWQAIGQSPFFGRNEIVEGWAHNVIVDAWSAFGLLGMTAALIFFLGALLMVGKALALTLTSSPSHRRVHATIAAFLCPAMVRVFTAPNVTIDFAAWVGLGIAVGLAADAWSETASTSAAPRSAALRRGAPSAA